MFSTLLSNFNLLSKIIPRYLYFSTLSTISPSIVISNSFVFATLMSKKFVLHHVVNLSTSSIYCGMEFDKSTIAVSSEYFIKIVFSVPVQSFVYNVYFCTKHLKSLVHHFRDDAHCMESNNVHVINHEFCIIERVFSQFDDICESEKQLNFDDNSVVENYDSLVAQRCTICMPSILN